MSEQYKKWSPYNYAVNNPLRFIDPDGMLTYDWTNKRYLDDSGNEVDREQAMNQMKSQATNIFGAEKVEENFREKICSGDYVGAAGYLLEACSEVNPFMAAMSKEYSKPEDKRNFIIMDLFEDDPNLQKPPASYFQFDKYGGNIKIVFKINKTKMQQFAGGALDASGELLNFGLFAKNILHEAIHFAKNNNLSGLKSIDRAYDEAEAYYFSMVNTTLPNYTEKQMQGYLRHAINDAEEALSQL